MLQTINSIFIFFSLLTWVAHCDAVTTTIELDKIYDIQLGANDKFTFQIEIPLKVAGKPNLYISAYSPINDPYQQPTLIIISSDYELTCEMQSSNLNSVCFVPNGVVQSGRKFRVEATCELNCQAKLVAYLSETLELDLNEQVKITTTSSPIQKMIQVVIPNDYEFTEIQLMISIKNKLQVNEGVQMYINCGKSSLSYPSKTAHQNIKMVSWGQSKAAILTNGNQVSRGDTIYILIAIGSNTSLTFESRVVSNGTRYIQLNQYYYDWLQSRQRLYVLNLTEIDTRNLTSIYIQLTQFAGSPLIQVSLDKQFSTTKQISQSKTFNLRFEINPEMMANIQFRKVVFIRVSSGWEATFALYSRFKYEGSNSIQVGVGEYIEVRPNQIGVLVNDRNENFDKLGQIKIVQIKVENEGGIESNIRIFTCKQILLPNCKIPNKNNSLSNLSPNFQQLKTEIGKQTVKANYSSNNCLGVNPAITSEYFCIFVIVLMPNDSKSIGKYSVTILQQQYIIPLSEGKSRLSEVQQKQYKYFSFYLPEKPPVIIQVFFYINTLDGLTKTFASTEFLKPTIDTPVDPRIKVGMGSISFNGSQLKTGMYYLTVYGYEFSDFVVNVIVRRLDIKKLVPLIDKGQKFYSKTELSQIQLTDSIAQIFVLQAGKNWMTFIFKSLGIGKITLKITQIVGTVTTYVTIQTNHTRILCQENQCEINGQQWQSYLVEVAGNVSDLQRFSVVFKQTKQCYTFPIGAPVYVSLDKNDMECLEYTVNKQTPFQISSSLTNLQLLNQVVEVIIIFQNAISFQMTTNTYLFQNSQLSNNCLSSSCKITVKYISFDEQVQFETIAQKVDGVITLYDGVVQKLDINLTSANAVHYRYPLDIEDNIQIFAISESYCNFVVHAALGEEMLSLFLSNYPNATTPSNQSWYVKSSVDSPILTMMTINRLKIQKVIKDKQLRSPYLLISVYGDTTESQHCTYSIEVTQKQRILREGDQQIGILEPSQVVTYQVYPSQMSLLSIRSLYKDKCYKFVDDKNNQLKDNIYIESPKTTPIYYRIRASLLWNCMYQISLQNYQDNIVTVVEGFPTKVVAEYNQVTYLLYKHITNSSFKIYEFVEAGSARIYATPISAHDLQNGLKNIPNELQLSQFIYRDDLINDLYIEASQNSSDYCFDCYYLIAIRGNPSVQEEVVVTREETPVTIREHASINSYLDKNQTQAFVYYGTFNTNWSLSVDVVYGEINVTVRDMKKGIQENVIATYIVTNTNKNMVIGYNAINILKYIPTDSLDQQRKYKIEVIGLRPTNYHLQVIKYSGSYRIAQGITSKITVPAKGIINLEFDNNLDSGVIEVNIEVNPSSVMLGHLNVYYSSDAFLLNQNQMVLSQLSISGSVSTLTFNGKKGHYTIRVASVFGIAFEMIVLMPRLGMSELRVGHPMIGRSQMVFELYTDEDRYAIVQVFPCQGNVKIRGAENPATLSRGVPSRNQVQLLHQNLGGHFIVSTPKNISGEYYIRVQNKQYEANIRSQVSGIVYMIQYRTLKSDELNPYECLDADSYQLKIDSSSYSEHILVTLSNVKSLNDNIKVKAIYYTFTIGISSDDVKNYLFCTPSTTTLRLTYALWVSIKSNKFNYKISKQQILKYGGVDKDAYIGVTAAVTVESSTGEQYSNLTFLYSPGYLGKLKSVPLITDFGLFEVLVAITLAVTGLTICLAIINYLIKVWRGYGPTNELIEQSDVDKSNKNEEIVKSSQLDITNQKQKLKSVEELCQ